MVSLLASIIRSDYGHNRKIPSFLHFCVAHPVVSWNFKHIVHFEKIGGYEGVNSLRGYRSPRIYSPREVVTP
jgi:hypothetical protein